MLTFTYTAEDIATGSWIGEKVTPAFLVELLAANINSLIDKYSEKEITLLIHQGMNRICNLHGIHGTNKVLVNSKLFEYEPDLRKLTDLIHYFETDMEEVRVFAYSCGRSGPAIINDFTILSDPNNTRFDLKTTISQIVYRWRIHRVIDQNATTHRNSRDSVVYMSPGAIYPDDMIFTFTAQGLSHPWYVLFHASRDLDDHDNFVMLIHPDVLSFTSVQLCKEVSI